MWLFSALSWWLLSLVSAPFYRPPKDAIGAAVANIIVLATLSFIKSEELPTEIDSLRLVAIFYSTVVGASALCAAVFVNNNTTPLGRTLFRFSERFSNGAVLFGLTAFISIFGFYNDINTILGLTLLWLVFALLKPVEFIFETIQNWQTEKAKGVIQRSGEILRVDDPNIIRVKLEESEIWTDDIHIASMANGKQRYVLPLFVNVQNNEIMGTGLLVEENVNIDAPNISGSVFKADDPMKRHEILSTLSGGIENTELIGFVVEGSEISAIKFEVALSSNLKKGAVLFCIIEQTAIYYQIMNASTSEENFQQNPRGTHIVNAVQLGSWNNKHGFKTFSWLPRMNLPVFSVSEDRELELDISDGQFELGHIPGTKIKTKGNLPDLISYHTAILGVTGTGKTELVFDLIEEALHQGTKIICVDLTGEYRKRLDHLNPDKIGLKKDFADKLEQKLFDVDTGAFSAGEEKKALKEFQTIIREIAKRQVSNFLCMPGSKVALFELAEVTNTSATLLATEIYLSEVMLWARANRKSRRILIVLEEAHTIIPETSGSGMNFATQAVVSKIGQIALQGRKYGVGLFIVSQRTALVSKTVLSQCNTFLTHNLVDQTSLSFLMNIYDAGYVKAIPNLKFLEFIAFGKGVISERPLLLQREHVEAKKLASKELDIFIDINQKINNQQKVPVDKSDAENTKNEIMAKTKSARAKDI